MFQVTVKNVLVKNVLKILWPTLRRSTHPMHENMMLRSKAEQAFLEYRAREFTSRGYELEDSSDEKLSPGDLIFYRRMQVPQDRPANDVVDRPRVNISRYYGPARVLATETRVDREDGTRKAGAIVWAVCNGRLKKFHHSQVRRASETERLVSEGSAGAHFPWTFSALTELLDKGSFDDETLPRARGSRGRSQTPARSRSQPPVARRRIEPPEPPVPADQRGRESESHDPDVEEEELIPVPPAPGEKRPNPEPPDDEEMELLPVPDVHLASNSSPDIKRYLRDPAYLPDSFVNFHEGKFDSTVYHAASEGDHSEAQDSPVHAVSLDAPNSESEWKAIVKNPKRFIAKSVQKGVEVSYAKLNKLQRDAMDSAMQLEVDNWLKTVAVKAASQYVPRQQLLRMRWVLTFKQASPEGEGQASSGDKIRAKARIVILGYSDPHLLEASTTSPAMTRLSRQLLLNAASAQRWDILCGDVKSAFLQAKSPQADRGVCATPVPELSKALGLREGQSVQLLKSCYGLVSAPREWYNDVDKTLLGLGAEKLVTDCCVWRIRDAEGHVVGLVSSHVDDFLMAGNTASHAWQTFLHSWIQEGLRVVTMGIRCLQALRTAAHAAS